jgi:glutaredoxin
MKKTLITGLLIVVVVGLLSVVVLGSREKKNEPINTSNSEEITPEVTQVFSAKIPIFFYGNTCPHCADVERWMQENKVEEKIKITKKEVYDNQQNAQELTQTAKKCGLPTDSIGVPFLFAEGKCLIGTPDITSFLSQKAGIKEATDSVERSEK